MNALGDVFVTHAKGSTVESADPADAKSNVDPMEKLMGDWSWRPDRQPVDPGYVYSWDERQLWSNYHNSVDRNEGCIRKGSAGVCAPGCHDDPALCLACDDNRGGFSKIMPARRPWMVSAYKGIPVPPKRIGG